MMAAKSKGRKTAAKSVKRSNKIVEKTCVMKKRKPTTMNKYVPPEIVGEIFLNLPYKSLCRFRSISKQYLSQIDDNKFVEEHRKQNMNASHILTWDTTKPSSLHLFKMDMDRYTHTKTIPTHKYRHMLQSSHGMVCLHESGNTKIALFNPSSQEITPLPDLPEPLEYMMRLHGHAAPTWTEWHDHSLDFGFDPESRRYKIDQLMRTEWHNHSLGFGFDPESRRYKIVQLIVRDSTILRYHILTVTRNDSSWRTVYKSIQFDYIRYQPICVGGVLYWEKWFPMEGTYIKVLAFDLNTEEIKTIQSPAKWNTLYGNVRHLVVLQGKLCCYEKTPPTDTMSIWKMEYDSNRDDCWTLQYKLQICSLNSEMSSLIPLCLYGNKRIILQDEFGKGLYCYDIEDKSFKTYRKISRKVEGLPADALSLIVHSETITGPLD